MLMTSNVDPSKLSLNVKGAYTSPAVPRDFDIKTASATDLAHYGFPEGIKARIDSESSPFHRLFTRTWLPEHRIIPQLEVKIGRTHLLQPSSEQQKVRTDAPNTSNNWSGAVVASVKTAPLAKPGSPLDGYATEFSQQQHVNYIGVDNHIYELYYINVWKFSDLTQGAGAPATSPLSTLHGYATAFNQQQHVNYIGSDGHVHELVYDGAWKHNDLSAMAGATAAAPGSPLDGYATSFNQQQHVNYIGTDGHVHELVYDGAWKHNDLTTTAGASFPAPGSPLDGYSTEFNQQQHVNYIGTDGHVHELVYDGAWKHNDLSATAGAPAVASGSPLDGYPTSYNQQQHVNYIGTDGHVYELFYDGQWKTNDLRNASGFLSTLASATRLVGFETAFNQQQHVFFISVDNHLHELYW
jgi:hypothetical protein